MTGSLSSLFQLSFQVSPIIFSGGIASVLPGQMLPIIAITQSLEIAAGVLTGTGIPDSLDKFFAQYLPMPGGKLISQVSGKYPFANQAVAANAVIQQPLSISMMMIAPVRDTAGYLTKLPIFTALQKAIQTHNSLGGLYHVATPACVYTDCIMLDMTDITDGETKQRQIMWQIDFEQPLVTSSQAQVALNALMTKINGGSVIAGNPAWSGFPATIGSPASGSQLEVPGSDNLTGIVQQFAPQSDTNVGFGP